MAQIRIRFELLPVPSACLYLNLTSYSRTLRVVAGDFFLPLGNLYYLFFTPYASVTAPSCPRVCPLCKKIRVIFQSGIRKTPPLYTALFRGAIRQCWRGMIVNVSYFTYSSRPLPPFNRRSQLYSCLFFSFCNSALNVSF